MHAGQSHLPLASFRNFSLDIGSYLRSLKVLPLAYLVPKYFNTLHLSDEFPRP